MMPPYNLTGDDYIDTGITFAGSEGGYQKTTKSGRFGRLPVEIGGSSSTYITDGLWFNDSATTIAFFGGGCDSGSVCGAACLNLNVSAAAASWRLGASVFLEQPKAA